MTTAVSSVADTCRAARRAARELAQVDTARKDAALTAIAQALIARTGEILKANASDMESGRESGLSDALLDRLALDEARIAGIARAVEQIVTLPDPVGEVIEGRRLPNGLDIRKVRVPLGVVAVVYEARPNVTIDATALCLKSGNAIVLRGSSTAAHSNAVLAADRRRGGRRGWPTRGVRQPRRGRRARGARGAGDSERDRRSDRPARRRGTEGRAFRGRDGAGHIRGLGQLPRVRQRGR